MILGIPEIYQALLSQWTVAFDQTHLVQSRGPQIQSGRMPSWYYERNLEVSVLLKVVVRYLVLVRAAFLSRLKKRKKPFFSLLFQITFKLIDFIVFGESQQRLVRFN